MAVDMFLELENIDGESTDKSYKDKIDVLAWSWGMSQSGSFHAGGGGGAGKANFQDISVTKWVDKSTMTLMEHVAKGKHIASGKLVVRKAGEKPLDYITIELKKIMITSISTGGSGGEDKLTENVTLNFAEFSASYVPQKEDGSGDPAVEFAFNIAENSGG